MKARAIQEKGGMQTNEEHVFPNGKGGNADSEISAARPELAAVVTEEWEGCQGIRGS